MTHVSGNPTWQDLSSGGTPITAATLEAIEGALDVAGWWSGFPIPPLSVRQTSPWFANSGYHTFGQIVGPMWLPGPQTVDIVSTRVNVAGAGGSVGNVYYNSNVPGALPDRSTATLLASPSLAATGRVDTSISLVVPSTGLWFWFESTDTTAQVRAGSYTGPNANWEGGGSLDAAGFPVVGATGANSDLGDQYAPMLFFVRSA